MMAFTKKFLSVLTLLAVIFKSELTLADEANLSIKVLTPSAIKKIIGNYPTKGSVEEMLDFQELLQWQDQRTVEDCELADSQNSAKIKTLFASNNGPLTDKEASRLEKKLFKQYAEIGLNVLVAKRLYKRSRPYLVNAEIKPCIELEGSSSYPSGHATMARALGLIISNIYPERKNEIMKRAERAALNRVIGGVHHPSDIIAGKKLGDAVFELIRTR